MNASGPIRVLLVDDHVLFRKAVASLLSSDPDFELAGEAANGQEGLASALALKPDLILMDIEMPVMDGLEATRRIKAALPETRIVMLTVSDADENLFRAVQNGAQGYLLKEVDAQTFFTTMKMVADGNHAFTGAMSAKVFAEFSRQGARIVTPSLNAPLDPIDRELLHLIAEGKSNKEIADTLALAESTVKNRLRRLLHRLNLQNRVQLAAHALKLNMGPNM
jgi:two-component system, NarL family, nitrate/nitrite response regulator NarL